MKVTDRYDRDRIYEVVDVQLGNGHIQALYTYWLTPDPRDYSPDNMHVHEHYEVHTSIDKPVKVRINGEMLEIKPRQALIIAPGTLHNAVDVAGNKLIFSYAVEDGCPAFLKELRISAPYLILNGVDSSGMLDIAEEVSRREPGYYDMIRAGFTAIMIKIARSMGIFSSRADWREHEWERNHSTKFFLDAFFKENVRWQYDKAELAGVLGISIRQLERRIFSIYGITYREKIQRVRFQKARILLMQCAMKPAKIAEMLGYDNVSSFTKAFKKHFGVTPTQMSKRDMQS